MTQEEAEFVGFFMGEGSLTVRKYTTKPPHGHKRMYMPRIAISLRIDDLPLLKWVQKNFGGHVYYNKAWTQLRKVTFRGKEYTQNPTAQWSAQSVKDCLKIIALLEQAKMPANKVKQVAVFKKLLELKKRGKRYGYKGDWYTEKELDKIEETKLQLSSLKVFSV